MKYYQISGTEDGDAYIEVFDDEEELVKALNKEIEDITDTEEFLKKFKKGIPSPDIKDFGDRAIIIRGDIIVPKTKKVITEIGL